MIILIEGERGTGKTYLCRELYSVVGNKLISFNDGATRAQVAQVAQFRNRIPHSVVVITGDFDTIEYAESILRRALTGEAIVRLECKEPTL
tara:strand:+ start:814 stop:1086 length:273 start_codon:yes stop_codon:yes gene_type:complete